MSSPRPARHCAIIPRSSRRVDRMILEQRWLVVRHRAPHSMLPHMRCPRLAEAKSRGTGMKTGGASVAHGSFGIFWEMLRDLGVKPLCFVVGKERHGISGNSQIVFLKFIVFLKLLSSDSSQPHFFSRVLCFLSAPGTRHTGQRPTQNLSKPPKISLHLPLKALFPHLFKSRRKMRLFLLENGRFQVYIMGCSRSGDSGVFSATPPGPDLFT